MSGSGKLWRPWSRFGGRASQPGPAGARSGETVPEGVRSAGAVAPSRRRLAAAGFLLALTTLAGSTAAETRAPSGSDMGTPAVLGLRGYQLVRTAKRPLQIHGPFVLTARELAALRPINGPDDPGTEDDGDGGDHPCTSTHRCGGPSAGDSGPVPTPDPNLVVDSRLPGSDPQIAAGANFLVSTGYNQIGFFDKSAVLLTSTMNNQPFNEPISTLSFFSKLTSDINNHLNLPPASTGATVANGWGITNYYDARTIYDSYRKRFWITALARNDKALNQSNPILQGARRGKLAVAVSSTDDPRDDWYLYWWESTHEDQECNNPSPCVGEHGSDYPSIGISNLYFTTENGGGNKTFGKFYPFVTVTPADALAQGNCAQNCPKGWSFWDFTNADGSPNTLNLIQPAVEHGPNFPVSAFFATSFQGGGKSWLSSWMFFNGKMYRKSVPIKPFGAVADAQQPPQPAQGVPNPFPLWISNTGNVVVKAALRGTKLHATFQDCRLWPGLNQCLTSIRLVRVDVTTMVTPEIDRTFGLRNSADPPAVTAASYGVPAVEVNGSGDIGLVYTRSGANLSPEARYSLYPHGAADISASHVLHAGTGVVGGNCNAAPCKALGNLDVGGISVDDADDTAFWVAHGYANGAGGWTIAIGKFLGRE